MAQPHLCGLTDLPWSSEGRWELEGGVPAEGTGPHPTRANARDLSQGVIGWPPQTHLHGNSR